MIDQRMESKGRFRKSVLIAAIVAIPLEAIVFSVMLKLRAETNAAPGWIPLPSGSGMILLLIQLPAVGLLQAIFPIFPPDVIVIAGGYLTWFLLLLGPVCTCSWLYWKAHGRRTGFRPF